LKHEVSRKTIQIALHHPVEILGFHTVECREIAIQHHTLAVNQKNSLLDLFRLNQLNFVFHRAVGRAYRFVPSNQAA
jgi:hypothetical protein